MIMLGCAFEVFAASAPVVTTDAICQTPSIDGALVWANATTGASRSRWTPQWTA